MSDATTINIVAPGTLATSAEKKFNSLKSKFFNKIKLRKQDFYSYMLATGMENFDEEKFIAFLQNQSK